MISFGNTVDITYLLATLRTVITFTGVQHTSIRASSAADHDCWKYTPHHNAYK